jgi:hypothetical protein
VCLVVVDERIEVAVQFRACGGHRLDEVPGGDEGFLATANTFRATVWKVASTNYRLRKVAETF